MSDRCTAWLVFDGMPTRFECREAKGHIGMHEDREVFPNGHAMNEYDPYTGDAKHIRQAYNVAWWDRAGEVAAVVTGYEDEADRREEPRQS